MNSEYFSFTMGREELTEMHRAMLARFIIEETLREEHGLETIDYPEHLIKFEQMLGIDAEAAHALYHYVEEELWEHAWHAYIEEWAWHRAGQDADKLLSKKSGQSREELMGGLFDKNFERYAAEIDMQESTERSGQRTKRRSQK